MWLLINHQPTQNNDIYCSSKNFVPAKKQNCGLQSHYIMRTLVYRNTPVNSGSTGVTQWPHIFPRDIWFNNLELYSIRFYGNAMWQSWGLTWSKINSSIKTLQRATFQVGHTCSVSGEKHHLIPKVRTKQWSQVTEVIVVTSKIAPILVLNLRGINRGRD